MQSALRYKHDTIQAVKDFGQEAARTHGRSVLLVDVKPSAADGEKLNGLFSPTQKKSASLFSPVVQAVPRFLSRRAWGESHDFTPLHFLNRTILHPGVAYSTKFAFKKPYQVSRFAAFVLGLSVSFTGYETFDMVTTHAIAHHTLQQVESHGSYYDQLVNTDYRFHELKSEAQSAKLSAEATRAYAVRLRQIQLDYYSYIARDYEKEYKADPEMTNERILEDKEYGAVYFADIARLGADGVPRGLDTLIYHADTNYEVSSGTLDRLMKNRHFVLHKYEYIRTLIDKSQTTSQIEADRDLHSYYDNDASLHFLHAALERYQSGRWTRGELSRSLQLEAFWEDRIADYDTLGVSLRARSGNVLTDRALTLENAREEILGAP